MSAARINNQATVVACLLLAVTSVATGPCKSTLAPSDYKVLGLEQFGANGTLTALCTSTLNLKFSHSYLLLIIEIRDWFTYIRLPHHERAL